MERATLVGSRGLGFEMRTRVLDMGLQILTPDPLPSFPEGYAPPMKPEYGSWEVQKHVCENEMLISIPGGILVFDVNVKQAGGDWWRPDRRFSPYYTGPVIVLHEGMSFPDNRQWRPLNTLEAVCGLAQNLWVGSLRYYSVNCTDGSCQAYRSASMIVVECRGSRRGHHAAYTTTPIVSPHMWMKRV